MTPGYNTNGYAHHLLEDCIAILAGQGYGGIAITPDVHHLNPYISSYEFELENTREELDRRNLKCVIETGARFLLNAHVKHQPTLVSKTEEDRAYRFEFLAQDCFAMAKALNADCVSFWSGKALDNATHEVLLDRLTEQCKRLADIAAGQGIRLAFEPEPGMFIDTMDKFAELHGRVNHPAFGLTLDIGHLVCMNEQPASKHIKDWQAKLWNIHLDDMKPNVHDHLAFGEGAVDFADVFNALNEIQYTGGVYVELSRHSHNAVETSRQSLAFMRNYLPV